MQAIELIRTVESAGGRFLIDGDRLGIRPAKVAQPVLEEIKMRKWEIMGVLSQRPVMPAGVRLIRWEPRDAPVQLSRCETVTCIYRFTRSTLGQIDARLHNKHWLAGNWTLSTVLDRLRWM